MKIATDYRGNVRKPTAVPPPAEYEVEYSGWIDGTKKARPWAFKARVKVRGALQAWSGPRLEAMGFRAIEEPVYRDGEYFGEYSLHLQSGQIHVGSKFT